MAEADIRKGMPSVEPLQGEIDAIVAAAGRGYRGSESEVTQQADRHERTTSPPSSALARRRYFYPWSFDLAY
jgi:hypothetical protein